MMKSKTKVIRIKRAINVTKELRDFIYKNSNYRRKVWNDFVEEYKKNPNEFDPLKYKTKYFNDIEKPNSIYDEYCVGISEQVSKDMKLGLKIISLNDGNLHFKKFNKNLCSFKVHTKPSKYRTNGNFDIYFNRVHITNDIITFRVNAHKFLNFELREDLFYNVMEYNDKYYYYDKRYHYYFSENDIKEISFIHELGKFYISLAISVTYIKSNKNKRISKAGIDLGIHSPAVIFDTSNVPYSLHMSQSELNKIYYLKRRIKRLQHIMDKKKYGSKNYNRVLRKLCVSWYKIKNIRLNWRRKYTNIIAKRYKRIIVDGFRQPGETEHYGLPKRFVKNINEYNRNHAMYYFYTLLQHQSDKFFCEFIKAPPDTTRTCSKCGFINEHLPLEQRIFKCTECGYEVDRDVNASKNCYTYV